MRSAPSSTDAEQLRRILQHLRGVSVILFDSELRCRLVEGGAVPEAGSERPTGGAALADVMSPGAAEQLRPAVEAGLEGHSCWLELTEPSGSVSVVEVSPFTDVEGTIVGALAVCQDVTAQRAAEHEQRDAEARFEIAFDRAPIGMAMVALDGRLDRVNGALGRIVGHAPEGLLGTVLEDLSHPDDRALVAERFGALLETHGVVFEHRCTRADGAEAWLRVDGALVCDHAGRPLHVLLQVQDITERRDFEARLRHMADHDPLTGLRNRRSFEYALTQHVALVHRHGAVGSLLVLDLDGFKDVNDTLGHAAGDALLVRCARALESRLRVSDVLARLGGDEFAIILPREGAVTAGVVAESLGALIREAGQAARVSASVGVAVFRRDATAQETLAQADHAMYEAKAAGRDRFVVASDASDATIAPAGSR